MRVVKEVTHPRIKITIYQWNNRYLLKLEQPHLEQTFKIDQFEITNESDLDTLLNKDFIDQAVARFDEMSNSLQQSLQKL
ncbi:MAG: hypothetical protein L0Y35_02320 [Flammeovirgaceae bacterium]|nr:hypothetical protein [Flammeovirgaceae bacterium]